MNEKVINSLFKRKKNQTRLFKNAVICGLQEAYVSIQMYIYMYTEKKMYVYMYSIWKKT
jgi:hypothetical protein